MGGSESKTSSSHHDSLLSEEEKSKAQALFNAISHGKKSFTRDQFQHFTNGANSHLDSAFSDHLFDLICGPVPHHHRHHHHRPHLPQHHSHSEVDQHHFISHLGIILNGSITDKAKICMVLAAASNSSITAHDLISFVTRILQSYEKLLAAHCMAFQSWIFAHGKEPHQRLAKYLLADFLKPDTGSSKGHDVPEINSNSSFSESDIESWLTRCSLFNEVLDQVLNGIFPLHQGQTGQMIFTPRVPQVQDTNWSRFKTILDFPTVLFLNHALPPQQQSEWKLLFSNQTHGGSFSQLLQNIRNKGTTYIVVRDQEGHVFGGYASVQWEINSKFQGNQGCYLFKVNPFFALYRPTGYNDNYMYMNINVQTLPNGVGMGGQLEYFGLWIDQSYDNGHSKAGSRGCTTYGSPQLSGSTEFKVDTIEVWAVGKNKKDEDEDDEEDQADGTKKTKKSILDKVDNADKAILDMVDRGTISDAIRDEPEVEETSAHNTIISPF